MSVVHILSPLHQIADLRAEGDYSMARPSQTLNNFRLNVSVGTRDFHLKARSSTQPQVGKEFRHAQDHLTSISTLHPDQLLDVVVTTKSPSARGAARGEAGLAVV